MNKKPLFKRVLVANRGEIAVRIIRTLREMGSESVAIYSPQDKLSTHCALADYAVALKGKTNAETYLNIEQITQIIKSCAIDAVHPGYGFLSENPEFCSACEKLGVQFIGPGKKSMLLMGDKIQARALMKKNEIPVVPGNESPIETLEELQAIAQSIGFPVILKAAAGGGGRGMRVVTQAQDLQKAWEACQREAKSYFNNSAVFCERFVTKPRHIEIQILVDQKGNGIHLFERDCSIQRRHQKLFEEAPSAYLNEKQRAKLGSLALKAAKASGYVGAGTVEFICESPEQAYFMEMNARIQVEHPVTEAITGMDLIAEQIRIAAGLPLEKSQKDIALRGWSMEARINAENPKTGFIPEAGLIEDCTFPTGPFVRVDTHIYPGYKIPEDYDSMIAKVIVWGQTRAEAINRLLRSLSEISIKGVQTTAVFQEALLQHPRFKDGDFDTGFFEAEKDYFQSYYEKVDDTYDHAALAAVVALQNSIQKKNDWMIGPKQSSWNRPKETSSLREEL